VLARPDEERDLRANDLEGIGLLKREQNLRPGPHTLDEGTGDRGKARSRYREVTAHTPTPTAGEAGGIRCK
jgi:hypothetical protein